jgi:two-component system, sensor histidine kinase and response regulator
MHSSKELEAYIDMPQLLDHIEGDRELLFELLALCRDDLPRNLMALREAIDGDNFKDAAIAAHGMKGMMANLSAATLASMASEMESAASVGDAEKLKKLMSDMDVEVDGFLGVLHALEVD